jgi:PAS domain S-box-containing protein
MAFALPSGPVLQSLRFRLPLFLTLYSAVVGLVLFTVANEIQETAFERDFERAELVRATEIQSRTERAAERTELETAQREYGELAVFEEIRAAVFVDPDNKVVLSSRRDWIGRPLDLTALGLNAAENPRVEETMRNVRNTGRTESLFSLDRNSLTFVMPATVPVGPGELGATRGALILLVHDLGLSKAVNRQRLLRQFGVGIIAVFLAVVGLGISLHALVTRRIERLHEAMGRFAAGAPLDADETAVVNGAGRGHDEIAELHRHFNNIAASIRRETGVRRHAEDALRESEERFRSAMHHSPIGMALVSTSGEYLEVNPALCAIVGYSADELLATGFESITHPDDYAADVAATQRMLDRQVETIRRVKRYRHKDGRIRWVQVNSSLVLDDNGAPRYFVSQIQDITERKRADEDLRHANRALQTISNCNQVLVHATDEATLLREVCQVMVRDGGYRVAWVSFADAGVESDVNTVAIASDETDSQARIAWAAQGREQISAAIQTAAIRTGEPAIINDFRAATVGGPWRDEAVRLGYRSCVALPLVTDGRTFGALTLCSGEEISLDVSETALLKELADDLAFGLVALRARVNQRQAEAALRTANERYARQEAALTKLTKSYVAAPDDFTDIVREMTEVVASALSVALVAVWRHDENGTVTRCQDLFDSREGTHSEGLSLNQDVCPAYFRALAGVEVLAVTNARSDPRTSELAESLLVPHGITSVMCVPIRARGATVGVLSCKHVGDPRRWMPDEQAFALAVANLLSTLLAQVERQRLENQLRQAQKLEAIGRLAGGVAHDFNNILTVILGRAEEVAADERVPEDLRDSVADLSQNAQRATALTRQLLAFSRRQAIEVRDVDLNSVVANVTRLLHRVLGEDIVVTFTYSEQPLSVRADPGMIEQVLLNLAVNARDAMPDGGRLSIDTSFVERSASESSHPGSPGSWACLRVTDNGAGIAAEHLPHIFEPFFTTKDIGKGTGLGLATTYGIVQQHGGWIEVDSQIENGTEFRVFFPRVGAEQPAAAPVSIAAPAPRGRETIMVVEDEAGVRALVIKLLKDLGYRVLQAQSGPHALDVWRQQGDEVQLLITDIVMPDGMNGVELAERLRRNRPTLKVIYTSGYLADLSREDIARHSDAYIAKPFSLMELARLVRRTLDGGEPAVAPMARDA